MHIYLDSPANPTCTIRRWRFAAIALGMVAALFAFSAVASSTATYDTVPVAHAPISASSTVPPNIMLVLDDSGSMLWDYMPDWKYLASRDENDVINANDNGLYYNPAITYLSPPRADSTAGRPHRYKNQTDITHVPNDGFAADVGHTLDYSTPLHEEDLTSYLGEDNYQSQHLDFSVEIRAMDPDGPKAKHPVHGCNKWKSRKVCHYFQYATGPVFHSKIHYVASPAQGCMDLNASTTPTCVTASTMGNGTNGAPAGVTVGQNIANWFAYYHTRLLTAKSSMMLAFAHMDKAYRFGYISIGTYPSSTVGLAPFGDGIGGSRKDEFWKWIANMATGNQGTPLRGALNFVGQFYMGDAPWKTMSSDPDVAKKHSEKMLTCRQSYVILTTDGFWQGDSPLRSGDNEDGSEGPTIKGPNGQSYTYHPRPPYSDPYSDTLADVAMKYWKTDLRPGMANEVPTSVADPAFWQHMVTFTIGFGFTPHDAADKPIPMDQVFSWARGETGAIKNFRWPKPAKNSINNIADLAHAAVNGHGGFYSASNPEKIAASLRGVMGHIAQRQGSESSLATNSTKLKKGALAYEASYVTAGWAGDLRALVLSSDGTITDTVFWSAAKALPASDKRHIYTYNPASGLGWVVFKNPGVLSPAQQITLGADVSSRQKVINYLRGDHRFEQGKSGGIFRRRSSALGDMVHSQPTYVGAPSQGRFTGRSFPGAGRFDAYAVAHEDRQPIIYLAANDGMLHGFSATNGKEVFAYIPAAVITHGSGSRGSTDIHQGHYVGLSALASPDYGLRQLPHEYFNDGELTVADAYVNNDWRTILVGTTGQGLARAVYALDVTEPEQVKFLWERSADDGKANSDYIGQMTGKPVVAQVGDGQWAVLVGNGYNSKQGVSALLQFDLVDGTLSVHRTGDISTGNGLAAPAVWIDDLESGISTIAYAGDLHGQLWSFRLSHKQAGVYQADPATDGKKLFTTADNHNRPQPITAKMLAGQDTAGQRWVFFGTGRYLAQDDLDDKQIQTWYGLVVGSSDASLVEKLGTQGHGVKNKNLVQRHIIYEKGAQAADPAKGTKAVPALRAFSLAKPGDMNGKSGWFINLGQLDTPSASEASGYTTSYPHPGERMTTINEFHGRFLVGVSRIPDPEGSNPCHSSGSGWIMAVDAFTGSNPPSEFFDPGGHGKHEKVNIGGKDYYLGGIGFDSPPNNPLFAGDQMLTSLDNGRTASIHVVTGMNGRVSWRELMNE